MVGLVTSLASFALYLWYQWRISASDEVKNDKIAEITLNAYVRVRCFKGWG